jgi:hypothetical protein
MEGEGSNSGAIVLPVFFIILQALEITRIAQFSQQASDRARQTVLPGVWAAVVGI